jgi:polynucleotide 5'-kinase involved in rRNA processing
VPTSDTCMSAFTTTSLGILLFGSTTPNEKIKKAITSVPSIKADMLTYEKLIALGSVDTSGMVKKADALVRTHSNRMHIADSALQTFTTMMQPQEITAAIQRT